MLFLKLYKRKVQQQYWVALLLHAGDLVDVNKGKEQSDDKLNQSESSRLQTLLAKYKNNDLAKQKLLWQTNGSKTETMVGALYIAHMFHPGVISANDFISDLHLCLTSQQGPFYIYHLSTYLKTISDIMLANINLTKKHLHMLSASQHLTL